jgi:hypothetical protein
MRDLNRIIRQIERQNEQDQLENFEPPIDLDYFNFPIVRISNKKNVSSQFPAEHTIKAYFTPFQRNQNIYTVLALVALMVMVVALLMVKTRTISRMTIVKVLRTIKIAPNMNDSLRNENMVSCCCLELSQLKQQNFLHQTNYNFFQKRTNTSSNERK